MHGDRLEKLLRDVDAAQPLRAGAGDLAAQLRRRARRRVQARRAAAAAGLLVAFGGGWIWYASLPSAPSKVIVLATSPTTAIAPAPVDIAQLRRELARLNADAELHEQTALRILARERATTTTTTTVVVAPDANDDELEAARALLKARLDAVTARAEELVGRGTAGSGSNAV